MFIADLHIHSKYSRATSRDCVPEYLDLWARRKGIDLIGTGDFTHPAWRAELKEKLTPAEDGLYCLRSECRLDDVLSSSEVRPRFVLSSEISSIYKKNGRTRKVHNVILLPSLEAAESLSVKLEAIGNIHSDGRPILGLDSRDLLEITLETCPDAIFIPAHIWTPHFSLFGAFSGFDTIEECFEDLTPYIHALETGLSSDPPMNWRLSALDRFTLVSNSDAHSPSKLGREANLLDTAMTYPALASAIQGGTEKGFAGTLEFFPEEGKYHYDGHRNCHVCLKPSDAEAVSGLCPVCGKKMTIGVDHRVEQLADRPEGYRPSSAGYYQSLVPLPEVIGASTGLSSTSKKVLAQYETMLRDIGPEFYILREAPFETILPIAGPCVEEGIRRLRDGRVSRTPGYDGEYGTIQLLSQSEIDSLTGQLSLFAVTGLAAPASKRKAGRKASPSSNKPAAAHPSTGSSTASNLLAELNPEQQEAVLASEPAIAVIAGPGTGKTKTLISRIAYLVEHQGVNPSEITAVTFTNKAAGEMKERLDAHFHSKQITRAMTIGTFHSICLQFLSNQLEAVTLVDEYESLDIAKEVLLSCDLSLSPRQFLRAISTWKCHMEREAPSELMDAFLLYQQRLSQIGALDFDDLLIKAWEGWQKESLPFDGFAYLCVDEFQDINEIQYQLIRSWSRHCKGLFVIGDPDQSIYGFRGSDSRCFSRLTDDFPSLRLIRLLQNYRSTPEILYSALPMISQNEGPIRELRPWKPSGSPVRILTAESDLSEAIFIAKEINRMVGGIDMLDAHTQNNQAEQDHIRSFSDMAILYRTHRQGDMLERCLRQEGIPYVVAGRDDFLADEFVRASLGFFRFILNPGDIASLIQCLQTRWKCPEDIRHALRAQWMEALPANQGDAFVRLQNWEPLRECLRLLQFYRTKIVEDSPRTLLESWIQDWNVTDHEPLQRLINMSIFHDRMEPFLQTLLLGEESDLLRSGGRTYDAGTVTLMTLHGSKGLEFPVVFLCGVNKGLIPLESAQHPADIPEERRLFYVGMTRAKEDLILLTSSDPSPFLSDIPMDHVQSSPVAGRRRPSCETQLSLF